MRLTNPGWVTVHLNLPNPNLNTATLASFTVTVRVPSSHAVAGAAMNAHALLQYPDPQSSDIKAISTNNVTTQLLITNHWQVRKYAINTFHVGNGPLGTCNDAIVSHTIRYRVEIFLQNGADIKGSQDITLTSMRDFPVATGSGNLAGCTFGNIVNEFNMANLTGFGGTYGSFTIPAGAIVLQAANALNNTNHRFTFEMTLPANISNPSCIDNHINFTSVDFCGNAVLPPQSFHSFVEKRAVAPADVVVTKNVWQAGNTRGCPGFYSIRVMNRTNSNLSGFTLYDVMPDCMIPGLDLANVTIAPVSTTGTLGTFANCTTCFTQHTIGTFPTRTYKIFSNANILINEGQEIRIPFTIGNTCHDCFTNFVFDNDQHTQLVESEAESHSQICLLPDATIPCVRKSVCENKQYKIDGIIRFRLAIQNYGTVPMTGWTLKDDLKRVGLSYVGNESFYVATHRSAGGSTCLGFNPASYPTDVHKWSLTSPAPYNQPPAVTYINTPSTREVSFQFTTFDLGCDGNTLHENNINNCIGAAGQNLPAFFIEFDAKVESDAGIGESMNISTLFDATLPIPVQHVLNPLAQAPFTVTDDINLTVKKEVSVDGGATFHTGGVTAQAGQTIQYKLTVDNTGLALQQPFLLDYLPSNSNDPGSSTPIIDKYLLANTTNTERGSNCDVFYRNAIPVGSTPGFTERFELSSPQPTDFNASDNFDLGSTGRQGLFQSQWSSTTPPDLQTKNFKVFYSVLPSGSTLTYKFDSEISSNSLTGQLACNTFAVRGRKKSMYNYQPQSNVLQLPAESPVVCVQVANPPVCCTPTFNIPQDICKNRATQFCVADGCECQPENMQNIYTWEFSDGTTYTGLDKCVSHAFPDARPYTISISWIDCNGQQQGPQVFYRDVMPCDECSAVNAMYTVTTSPTNSLTHTYDPTSSTTTGMQIIGYSWHLTETSGSNFVFNDITYPPTPQNSSANPNLTITFPGSGTYCMTLTLLMLDPDGNACKCNPSISECIEDGGALQDKFPKNMVVRDNLTKINYNSLLKGKFLNEVKKSNYSTLSSCCRPETFDIPNEFCPNVAVQFCVKDDCVCLTNDEQNVYTWYFDDGVVLTGKCISRAFTTPNLYHVVLTYINCQNETIDDYPPFEINVKNCPVDECPNVIPDFTATPAGPGTIRFTSTSQPSSLIALYVWDFGDQTSDVGPVVNHTYTPGGAIGNTPSVTLHVYINNSTGNPCSCPDEVTHIVLLPDHRQSQTALKKVPLKNFNKPDITLVATPNPFSQSLNISLKTSSKTSFSEPSYTLSIINTIGATLMTKFIGRNTSMHIDTRHFVPGMYLVSVIGSNGTIYKTKVIKIN